MALQIHRDGDDYYAGGMGAQGEVRWTRDGDRWVSAIQSPPPGAMPVTFGDLPADLREELLAFAARAELLGRGT